jgi:hypothetical protein
MANNFDEETLKRMGHNMGDSITTTATCNKAKQEFSILRGAADK